MDVFKSKFEEALTLETIEVKEIEFDLSLLIDKEKESIQNTNKDMYFNFEGKLSYQKFKEAKFIDKEFFPVFFKI